MKRFVCCDWSLEEEKWLGLQGKCTSGKERERRRGTCMGTSATAQGFLPSIVSLLLSSYSIVQHSHYTTVNEKCNSSPSLSALPPRFQGCGGGFCGPGE
ncbi:uncharacterized protein K489DRAFT_119817 [Dissoconium aciculare CBS 342.82]|uniref:Uncharacterized protein n=1 Tax=Dissoconium aciculare CBS 342.82 TaxID=1314786 RepID=A0A6J3MI47_9PEZI|nr:uncharacterized protein K489DRAFT_119817 [Dissoconium aciculare CBS 342.82]KAF1826577.1 hypothetical protein K489DRAFT_119817 [Dissoconium aciculare CBS 342.82]